MAIGDPQPDLQRAANNPGPAPAGGDFESSVEQPKPEEVKLAPAAWTDDLALRIVVNDFERASQHRSQNYDPIWDDHDNLLHANVAQKTWPGTNVPRSSLGVKLVWQQIESLLPALMEALFASSDGIFFDCFPRPGTSPAKAISVREVIAAQLDNANVWEIVNRLQRCKLLHGTGILKCTWKRTEKERAFWSDEYVPNIIKKRGQAVAVGQKRQFKRRKIKEIINNPELTYVSIRDFYIDPGHKLPCIDGSQFVLQRAFVSMDELLFMGENDPSYTIPSKSDLIDMVRKRGGPPSADGDTHKQISAQEAGVFESYPRGGSIDPAKQKFELLEYWTEDRMVTVLNRNKVIRNIANPYMRIPFISDNYADVLDQFYGKGIADIIGDEQRLQAGLVNSHIDEVSLNIHGAVLVVSGSVLNKQQLRRQPGQVIEGTSKDAVTPLMFPQVTQDWQLALQQSQIRSQQYAGVTDIVVSGAPQVQTSLTRTAQGVGALTSAAHGRIQYGVQKSENNMVVPMLDMVLEMNQRFLDPRQTIQIIGKTNSQLLSVNPMDITNGQFSFELRAASRMASKQAMASSIPFLLQNFMNPGFQAEIAQQGLKLNVQAVTRDTLEALGWRSRSDWFVPLTPEDEKARQQEQGGLQIQLQQMKDAHDNERMQNKNTQGMAKGALDLAKLVVGQALKDAPGAASSALSRALDSAGAHEDHGDIVPG